MANIPVDATAFAVFEMHELSADSFDAGFRAGFAPCGGAGGGSVLASAVSGDLQPSASLAAWVAGLTGAFLRAQAVAGASAVQLFDSWAGALSLPDYARFVAPHSAAVLAGVADLGIPRVHFGVGTGELLVAMRDAGADVMGVDHRVPLDTANSRLGGRTPLQGNIDPALLFAGQAALHAQAADVIRRGATAPGHVVNLGHGVPPDTDPDVLTRLVEFVHTFE